MSETVTASHVFLGNTATSVDEVLLFLSEKAVELGITDETEPPQGGSFDRDADGHTDGYTDRDADGYTDVDAYGYTDGDAYGHADC